MATTPLFNTPDGTATTSDLQLVTSVRDQTFTGVLASNIVDVQVKVNGGQFVSDPSLITFDQTSFTVPNPLVYPEGLRLEYGVNSIQLRAVDITGAVSDPAVATVNVVKESELALVVSAPTGLRVRRQFNAVELVWAYSGNPNIIGYNVYASTESAGGASGYYKVNADLITESSFTEDELTQIDKQEFTYTRSADYLRYFLAEEDIDEVPVATVADFAVETSFIGSGEIKVTAVLEDVTTTEFYTFTHNREDNEDDGILNNEIFGPIPADEPLFYVITAVVYDPITNQQIESVHSAELVGLPLILQARLTEIPTRNQEDIQRDYIQSILRANDKISAIPGSTVRDIFVEPFSSEEERLHFIANFIRRSQSFATLLAIDDLDGDQVSDPVSENSYKTALKNAFAIESDADVQALIDDAFDKLASNSGITRGGSEKAIGEVVFFTSTQPTQDLVVPVGTLVSTTSEDGSSAQTFETTARRVLPADQLDSYYNLQLRRWEITANIRAVEAGAAGNVAAAKITRAIGNVASLQVTNDEATRFGQDEESNYDLATRGILAFSSVDAGTPGGYLATALKQPGVFRALVIEAGDEVMMRDWDEVREKHIGGKVDVWVQGSDQRQVTDTFALKFQVATNIQFFLDSSPGDLIFRADDPRLSTENPITQMLGVTATEVAQGFGFRNVSTGQDFDLTNVSILDYNRIQLDTTLAQPAIGVNDIIVGDYRFQADSEYIFSRQPVFEVESVRSLNNNVVLEVDDNYSLVRQEDPLLSGYSTIAQDSLLLQSSTSITLGGVFVVNDERRVLVGESPEPLLNLGVNPVSVRVFNLARTIEYNGPNSPSPDFLIEEGSATTPLNIIRVPAGNIANGEEVSVDYEHDENFEVEYTINDLLSRVQNAINTQRHTTADVLVKQAVANQAELEITVILSKGAVQSQVDAELRTAISLLLNSKPIGEPVYQSDVVKVIEDIQGVVYVVVPFAKMAMGDDSLIIREDVNNDSDFLEQRGALKAYIFKDDLEFPTMDGGGTSAQHRGVFEDSQPMTLVNGYNNLFSAEGSALLVGDAGLSIAGYSDDPTLTAQGFNTPAEREAQRLALTANRVFVALDEQDTTAAHEYTVSYNTSGDSGAKDLLVQDVSYLELGALTITYRRDKDKN